MVNVQQDPTQRAKELRARLLKQKEIREQSATPSSGSPQIKQQTVIGDSITQRASPKPALPAPKNNIDIDKLISEFSAPKETAVVKIATLDSADSAQQNGTHKTPKYPEQRAKSPVASSGSPTKSTLPATHEKPQSTNDSNAKKQRQGSLTSDISEGEIFETPSKPERPATTPKKTDVGPISTNNSTVLPTRVSREEYNAKSTSEHNRRRESPPRRAAELQKPQRPPSRDSWRKEQDNQTEGRRSQTEYAQDRKLYQEPDQKPHSRKGLRDQSETFRKAEASNIDQKERRAENRQAAPTLEQVLEHDNDLKDWLDFTGYHNSGFRERKLAAHRKIAALDAQKEKILAELASQEHGISTLSTMAPPAAPTKASDKTIAPSTDVIEKRVSSNKRPYSDFQEQYESGLNSKISRYEDRGRVREEIEDRRPKSGGYNSSRRSSFDYLNDERNYYGREDGRIRGRADSRESSPGGRGYDDRSAVRYKFEDDNQDDWSTPRREHPRGEFVKRGNYQGRHYDANYDSRGRGRAARGVGRGRGDRDREDYGDHPGPFPRGESKPQSYGQAFANRKPFKDEKGLSKGSKGDTRYFIVKSFNEDNVLRCIEDSIWTTQVHVGEILKEAFLTCKNVILVFSINKSKAFQGYARMESLPGTAEVPWWQKTINWESAGAFRVRWLVVCATRFQRVGHLKNACNENLAVLIGKDGQEVDESCGSSLVDLIDIEAEELLASSRTWHHDDHETHVDWAD
ncbi:hypothetical protein PVAG01_05545 [Phlyctema vagabunda]|uniref:YTH domain-containing protein n=1 Tax=Phlyctema vagabunda TaxID=108571 RepID=A0ABR4PKD6_9HELO